MSRQFVRHTSVRFTHQYYTSGDCNDLRLLPTTETEQLIRQYKLLWGPVSKLRPSEYQLLRLNVPTGLPSPNDWTTLVELPTSFCLRFAVHCYNKDFANFTKDITMGDREVILFENQSDNVALVPGTYRKIVLIGGAATVTGMDAGATVTVAPPNGGNTWEVTADEEAGEGVTRIDLEKAGHGPGVYSMTWLVPSPGSSEVYYDPALGGQGLLGILHLKEESGLSIAGNDYLHDFEARAEYWRYFIACKDHPSPPNYEISNAEIDFTEVSPAEDLFTEAGINPTTVTSMFEGAEFQAFKSDVPIAFREEARSLIGLVRLSPSSRTVIRDLPNPPAGSANGVVFVTLGEPIVG